MIQTMCNDYEQHIRWDQYCATMQAAELGIPTGQSELDLPVSDDIKINDKGPVTCPCMLRVEINTKRKRGRWKVS
jgi:hypothetical protein